MKAELKLNKNRILELTILPDETTKKSKDRLELDKFFLLWSSIINEARCVEDFSFSEPGVLHVHWFEIKDNKYMESDIYIDLDESVIDDDEAYNLIVNLCDMFKKVKRKAVTAFYQNSQKYKQKSDLREQAIAMIIQYSKDWALPLDKDEKFLSVADWIVNHKQEIVHSKMLFGTKIEVVIVKFLRFLETCIFLGGAYMTGTSLFGVGLSLSPFLTGIFLAFTIMTIEVGYKGWANERTYGDFVEDIYEYEEKKQLEFLKCLQEEFAKSEDLIDEVIMSLRKYMDANVFYEFDSLKNNLDEFEAHRGPTANLSERIKRLEELLSLEKDVYSKETRTGLKKTICEGIDSNILARYIRYLTVCESDIENDVFLRKTDSLIKEIVANPYYRCEADVIAFVRMAVKYMHLRIKYNDMTALLSSNDYKILLDKWRIVNRRAKFNQEGASTYSGLLEARETLREASLDEQARVQSTREVPSVLESKNI